jgi:hypothetical protein
MFWSKTKAKITKTKEEKNVFLNSLKTREPLIIEAIDIEIVSGKQKIFSEIDDFFAGDENKGHCKTEKTLIQVCELIQDTTLINAYLSTKKNLDELCFSKEQIKYLLKEYHFTGLLGFSNLMTLGNFFLTKTSREYFIMDLALSWEGLKLYKYPLGFAKKFDPCCGFLHVFFPKTVI